MAARNNPNHSENTKGEIKASQLLNRLYSFAIGEEVQGKIVEMSPAQVQAAKTFIAKYKADLKSLDIKAKIDGHFGVVELPHKNG
jgi:multidrug resistance efflux pump